MKLSSRNREYLDCAMKYGFKAEALYSKDNGIVIGVTAPSGVSFETRIPKSPSSSTGPRNWVQNLRRIELKILTAQTIERNRRSI